MLARAPGDAQDPPLSAGRQTETTQHRLTSVALLAVMVATGLIYSHRLGDAPVYLGWDEARTALQGYSLARTGRDMEGTRLPLFFHITDPLVPGNSTATWWQPTLFYLTAAVLLVAPLAEWSVRVPNVALATLNVLLIALVARRLTGHRWSGVIAAGLLALTPAHFFFARLAQDYFLSQTYALLWLCLLLTFLDSKKGWLPTAMGLVLGIGIYTHIASWIVMPFFLVVTVVVFFVAGRPVREQARLLLGFAAAMLPLAAFLWFRPSLLSDMFLNYRVVTTPSIAERVTLYWDYFNPSFLFFSGGSDPMWATRRAGVFLLAIAVLLPCGILSIVRRGLSIPPALVLIGFAFAPAPIVAALPEAPRYATARDLLVIPFGVLLSVMGVGFLAVQGRWGRLAAAALLVSVPVQFLAFTGDYYGDYQRRSSFRHDSANTEGAVEYVIGADAANRIPAIYLSDDLGTGKSVQWQFHLTTHGRPDLWERTRYFNPASLPTTRDTDAGTMPPGSLLVIAANHERLHDVVNRAGCSLVHEVLDVAGSRVTAILRRN